MPISRSRATDRRSELRRAWDARLLPRPVSSFYLRALRVASRENDRQTFESAAQPKELAKILELSRGREEIVQIGRGTVWTAIALALNDPRLRVTSIDPTPQADCERYLALVPPSLRERVVFLEPEETVEKPVDLVLLDGSPDREETVAAFSDWEWIVRTGGLVVFRRYRDPDYKGVADAVTTLQLAGSAENGLFVWRKPPRPVEIKKERRLLRAPLGRRLTAVVGALIAGLAVGLALGIAAPLSDGDKKTVTATVGQTQTSAAAHTATKRQKPPASKAKARPSRKSNSDQGAKSRKSEQSTIRRKSEQGAKKRKSEQGVPTRSLRTFSGTGRKNLGTIRVRGPSVLKWTTRGTTFSIASDALRLNSRARKGSTVVSRGRYRHFRIRTKGRWTLKLEPINIPAD